MEYGQPVTLTATGTVSPRSGRMTGFYVNSTTAGTIVLTSGGVSSGTITPAVGWHFYPIGFPEALTVVIGGVLDVTFMTIPS